MDMAWGLLRCKEAARGQQKGDDTAGRGLEGRTDLPLSEENAGVDGLAHRAQGTRLGVGPAQQEQMHAYARARAHTRTHTHKHTGGHDLYNLYTRQGPSLGPCIPYKYRVLSTKYR